MYRIFLLLAAALVWMQWQREKVTPPAGNQTPVVY